MADFEQNFNIYDDLKESLADVIAYKHGDKSRCRFQVREIAIPRFTGADVHRLRARLNLSQPALAVAVGVSKRTVEAWEAGVNEPSGAASHLLYLISKQPKLLDELITRT